MDDVPPWDTGDDDLNWVGYFIPGTSVLRNRVGATTRETLAAAENDLVEVRVAELRNNPRAVIRTYDLDHLKALHQYLFQDVYLWAGELRTVGIEKEDESFMTPGDIGRPVAYIAVQIAETNQLRSISNADLPGRLAEMYDFVNFAHPFREGSGRTQREFFDQLLSGLCLATGFQRVNASSSSATTQRSPSTTERIGQRGRSHCGDSQHVLAARLLR